jgi:glycosyltransferase involved in cell wall biosynthesis
MKILMVHDIGMPEGGAEILLTREVEALSARGHEVFVLTSDAKEPTFAHATFRVADETQLGKVKYYLYNRDAARTLIKVLSEFKPDIVHLHTITKASPSILRVLRRRGMPTVMTLHDYGLLYPRMGTALAREAFCGLGDEACCARHAGAGRYYFERLRTGLHRRERRAVRTFIAPSYFVADVAEHQGFTPLEVLPNPGIDAEAPARKPEDALIVYSGRLEPEKGIRELIAGFELVRQELPKAKLVLVGGGSLFEELSRRKLPGVTLTGLIPYAKVERYYQRATLLTVPSLWPEPFGLIGPEAMRFGLPIVASGTGGMGEWALEDQTAVIADPRDARVFADALVRVLRDQKLQAKLSRNSLAKVKDFSLETHAANLENIYERARQATSPKSTINEI